MAIYCAGLRGAVIDARLSHKKCGYCRSNKELHGSAMLAPRGFCADAFYAVYPYLLALLYDANFSGRSFAEGLIIRCPNPNNPSLIKLTLRFKKARVILNLIENISRAIGFPKDAIDKLAIFEVVSAGGQCCLKGGELFKLNIPDIENVCPAAFFSMYPLLSVCLQNNGQGLKQTAADRINFLCPDPETNIIYGASLARKGSTGSLRVKNKPCDYLPDMSKYKIAVSENTGCLMRSWPEKEISLDKLLPTGICPFVFNVAIPYIITLYNSGHFKWRKDINTVEAQCPSCQGQAVFEIKRDKSDFKKISLIFNKIRGSCPHNHQQGQSYLFDFSKIICPHLFVRVFPLILMLEYASIGKVRNDELMVTCPFKEKTAAYRLIKNA